MRRTLITSLILIVLLISACSKNATKPYKVSPNNFNYTGGNLAGNYVWGGAMNLAWNELSTNIIKEPIDLDTSDPAALATLKKLNTPVFTREDMDSPSYYVKSGYGQETVTAINSECRQKFPKKSIPDLKIQLAPKDIISYAYFLKEITYQKVFSPQNIRFDDRLVQGFRVAGDSYQNIYILDYQNVDKFLIGIKLQDESDQIFLAKGYDMDRPDEVVKALREKTKTNGKKDLTLGEPMNSKDVFHAPMLHLEQNRSYQEMVGKDIANKLFRDYVISVMQEVIKFDMDEKGARVENEAIIAMITSVKPQAEVYKPKIMKLDKPYWVVMKRADSANPYFILGVNNTSIMKPAE